ncbi:MAG: hypothetical protein IPF63_03095 [Bacteroidetes bacterium]|nr:hypothetical protein [Bacteroidota bacterium]
MEDLFLYIDKTSYKAFEIGYFKIENDCIEFDIDYHKIRKCYNSKITSTIIDSFFNELSALNVENRILQFDTFPKFPNVLNDTIFSNTKISVDQFRCNQKGICLLKFNRVSFNVFYLQIDQNYNDYVSIEEVFSCLPDSLIRIIISVNGNIEIPNNIEKFQKLEWLDLSADSISFFSPKLCELPNLKMININRISKINTIYSKDSLCGLCKNTFNVLH